MTDAIKKRALRRAIDALRGMPYTAEFAEDIAALEDLLVDVRQIPLPLVGDDASSQQ